jgi:hypothetical protein
MPGHVAGGPDPRVRGLEIVTDLDRLAFGELDPSLLQAQAFGVRPPAAALIASTNFDWVAVALLISDLGRPVAMST